MARIAEMLRSMSNHHLLSLAECYLVDESLMDTMPCFARMERSE